MEPSTLNPTSGGMAYRGVVENGEASERVQA